MRSMVDSLRPSSRLFDLCSRRNRQVKMGSKCADALAINCILLMESRSRLNLTDFQPGFDRDSISKILDNQAKEGGLFPSIP